MPNVINATSTGNGGLISQGDDSGILNIQTNEVTAITVDASQKTSLVNDATISGLTVGKGGGAVATNTGYGVSALSANTSGSNNVAVGYRALSSMSTGNTCVAVGQDALKVSVAGTQNTAIGFQSMLATLTADGNSGLGVNSLSNNTTGNNNTACGYSAGQNSTTAANNVLLGYQAGANLSTGSSNLCVGYQAGANATNLTTGVQNILIGYQTNPSASGVNYEITMTTRGGSGKGSATGYIDPQGGGVYQGNNSSSWSTTSDQRLKKNIIDNTEGLDVISQIRVRNFEYRTAEEVTELPAHTVIEKEGVQLGVIAQELQEVCPDCIKEESTGVISVDSDNIFWHMVNAIKDLKAINDTQAETINALTARIVALEEK